MELHILIDGRKDLSGQVVRQLRAAIKEGRLAPGEQLPPSRLLASQLQLARKTVADAYARLVLDGLLATRVGRGTYVAERVPASAPAAAPILASPPAALAHWQALPTPLRHPHPDAHSRFEFIGGQPARAPFPHDEWRRCILAGLRADAARHGRYAETEGVAALRQAIAGFIGFTRGVRCTAAEVLVTHGAQQALDLLARVLVTPGDVVAVEEPGYPPARQLFASRGARVVPVPVDAEGLRVDAIPADARLVYVTPSHQFPLGMPLSAARRQALLDHAHKHGAIVVEDDYDSAFRHAATAQASLQAMDRSGCVVYVGTFSKVMMPEIRAGYLVAPPALVSALATAKYLADGHSATLVQHALAGFIDNGGLARHIRRCHAAYAARRERLLVRLDGDLSPWLEPIPTTVGFHLSAWLRRALDVDLLCRLARRAEVGLYPLAPFYAGPTLRQGLLFGFGAIDSIDIDEALDRVLAILRTLAP